MTDIYLDEAGKIDEVRKKAFWENQIKISSIEIKKFRSIWSSEVSLKDFNIFVGANDAGKSNIIKALNLFFNGETDYGEPFDFERDFSQLYELKKSHSKKEILIAITFFIPDTYQGSGYCTWTKVWDESGEKDNGIKNSKGEEFGPRSRVPYALRLIKFRYVPAVKSSEFYRSILADLYEAGAYSTDSPFYQSVDSFSNTVRRYTAELKGEIKKYVGINSILSFPESLSDIFGSMIFETSFDSKNKNEQSVSNVHVPLNARGDGIQACHIPAILHFIAQEDRKARKRGAPQISTIWGYEEPENGLELARTFEVADELAEYSGAVQILTTTHSPALYMKKETDYSKVFYISKKDYLDETVIAEQESEGFVSETMGLMKIVAPYIRDTALELQKTRELVNTNILTDVPTVIVEGKYDIKYLKLAVKLFSPFLSDKLEHHQFRIVCNQDNAGTEVLVGWAKAWMNASFHSKAFCIVDHDQAGEQATVKIKKAIQEASKKNVKVDYYKPSPAIKKLYSKKIITEYDVEHLLSGDFWKLMIKNGYAKLRKNKEVLKAFEQVLGPDDTLSKKSEELLVGETDCKNIVWYEPIDEKKGKIFDFLSSQSNDIQKEYLLGFQDTVSMLENYFQ